MNEPLAQAGTVLASALVASLAYYAAKRRGTDEPFRPTKAAATVLAAFGVSVVLLVTGEAAGREDLLAQLSLFVGPVAVYLQKALRRAQETD
jgi:drug/metabolite transporter (DMT)-like permease